MQMELQNYILATAPWSWTMKQIQPISSYFCQGNKVCASVFPITPLIKASLHWLLKQVKRTFHSSASLKAHKTSPTSTQAKFVSAVCSAIWNSTCYITELTLVQITAIINVTWPNDHTGTSVASHEPSQLASKDSLKKVTTYVNLFSWMFLLRPWTFSLLQKGKNTCSSFCPAEDLWQAACSYHLNERRLWSESLCFELCIWDMVQRSTLQPMTELQGFKCWAVFVKGTVNSPKRRPSSQVIPHDKYNFCNASLHFKRTRSQ